MRTIRWAIICFVASVIHLVPSHPLHGQAGLRESLERLDRNENGEIDPEEITPLARPYLERVARARRMSLDRPNDIERWQEAARVYYALQNGVSGRDVRPEGENSIKSFGPGEDEAFIPEFGLPEVKFPYIQDDLDEADRTIRRADRNRDGFIDRAEAARAPWTHRNPFDDDLNKDDRLSRMELGQRYARRRLLENDSDELVQRARRTGNGIRKVERAEEQRRSSSSYWRRGSRYYLTSTILSRFDSNKNGRLDEQEALKLGVPIGQIDSDRNGELSRDELQAYFSELQDQSGGLVEGVPAWFYELDANRDRQIAMSEFATEWTDEKIREFSSLDINDDGLLTAAEILQAKSAVGGSYANDEAEIIPPKKTIISEIEVTEDYLIGDLNVQLSMTHTYASHLDAYLTGPDGQRVELFTEVGGSDDHFEDTVFDDQSRYPITKARPPFKGTFAPEGVAKRQPSLSHFNGKSIKGVWQLVIRASRSDRFGMLHRWSLIVTPKDDMLDAPAAPPAEDGPSQEAGEVKPANSEPRATVSASLGEDRQEREKRQRAEKLDAMKRELAKLDTMSRESADEGQREKLEARKKAYQRYMQYLETRSSGDPGSKAEFKKQFQGEGKR